MRIKPETPDHAEYPTSAEVEQRCIRIVADLLHAPGKTTGAHSQGSSAASGDFELIGDGAEQLPLVAYKLASEKPCGEIDISCLRSAERRQVKTGVGY